MKLLLILSICLMAVLSVSADQEPVTTIPQERAYDDGQCFQLEVKMLNLATTVGDENQESYLRSADAYHRLDALGQKCQ